MRLTPHQLALAEVAKKEFFRDPVAFALNAVIFPSPSVKTGLNEGGRMWFALVPEPEVTAKKFHGDPIPVYYLQQDDPTDKKLGAALFPAYWCPYENNAARQITLWTEANAMFTATMDGCTFGIGSQTTDGAVRVAHVNEKQFDQKGDKGPMEKAQRGLARQVLGRFAKLLEPKSYRHKPGEKKGFQSTTFGIRNVTTGKWTFYGQQIEQFAMGEYILRGIKKFA